MAHESEIRFCKTRRQTIDDSVFGLIHTRCSFRLGAPVRPRHRKAGTLQHLEPSHHWTRRAARSVCIRARHTRRRDARSDIYS